MHIRIFSSETPGGLMAWPGAGRIRWKRWFRAGRANQAVRWRTATPTWSRPPPAVGRHINYHVDLDAFGTDALFFAGVPEMVDLRYPFSCERRPEATGSGTSRPGRHYDAYSRLEDPPETSPAP